MLRYQNPQGWSDFFAIVHKFVEKQFGGREQGGSRPTKPLWIRTCHFTGLRYQNILPAQTSAWIFLRTLA
jgi:hypothetical protein